MKKWLSYFIQTVIAITFLTVTFIGASASFNCFQEFANESTSCGAIASNNSYLFPTYATISNCGYGLSSNSLVIDGNYNTGTTADTGSIFASGYYFINYSLPVNYVRSSSLLKVKDTFGINFLTIPSACWDVADTHGVLRIMGESYKHLYGNTAYEHVLWHCTDVWTTSNPCHSSYRVQLVDHAGLGATIYEDGMNWTIDEVQIKNNYTFPSTVLFGSDFNYSLNLSLISGYNIENVNFTFYDNEPTSYVFDEYGDEYLVVNDTTNSAYYVNYTKPLTSLNSTLWQVKNNYGCGTKIQNYTIDSGCWEAYSNKLVLKYQPDDIYCYNSTSWVSLGLYDTTCFGVPERSFSNSTNGSEMFDGNWSTYSGFYLADWYSDLTNDEFIYEEGVWWAYPNYLYEDINSTKDGNIFTSQNYLINVIGDYFVSYIIFLNDSSTLTGTYPFTIIDTKSVTPDYYIQVKQPGDLFNLSINVLTDGDSLEWNATYDFGLTNITIIPNITLFNVSNNISINFSFNISSLSNDGEYNGTINFTRLFDGYSEIVELNITVSTISGDIVMLDDSTVAVSMNNGETVVRSFTLNNTGNGNLTNVTCLLEGVYDGFSFWSFDTVEQILKGSSAVVNLTISSPSTGSYSAYMDCYGIATSTNSKDYLEPDNKPLVNLVSSILPTSSPEGSTEGSTSSDCDLTIIYPKEGSTLSHYGATGKESTNYFTFHNTGAKSGIYEFIVQDSDFLEEHCYFGSDKIEVRAGLQATNNITCTIPEEIESGTLTISGCGKEKSYGVSSSNNKFLEYFRKMLDGEKIEVFGKMFNATLVFLVSLLIGILVLVSLGFGVYLIFR